MVVVIQEEDSSPGTEDEGLMGCGLVDVVSLEKGIAAWRVTLAFLANP